MLLTPYATYTTLITLLLLLLQEGHYNYELGENISSRCECSRGPWTDDVRAQHLQQHQQERSSSIWAPAQQPHMRLLTSARIKACSAAPKGPNIPNRALQAHACVALLA